MSYPSIKIEIAFSTAPLATTPTWTDVTAYVISIPSIRRGRQNPLTAIEAGTAVVVLDNRDRRFDPSYASGAYYPNVRPGRKIRISATYSATTYYLFTGYIEKWPPAWEASNKNSTVTITCADGFKVLNQASYTGTVASAWSDGAIGTMLDAVGWPAADRSIAQGQTYILGATLTNANVLQRCLDIVSAEYGAFFIRGDGFAVFQSRNRRYLDSASVNSQGTFGDGGELPYQSLEPSYDDVQIYNDIHITPSGGTEQIASDSTSQTNYFKRNFTKTGVIMGDSSSLGGTTPNVEALSQAQWILYMNKDPQLRFDSIVLDGNYVDTLWPKILGLDISYQITVKRRPPPSGSTTITQNCWIEAIEHRITDITATYLHWQTTWQLSPINPATWWILENATYGILDSTTRLAY